MTFYKNQKMMIDDMIQTIKACKHEDTIDLGDAEHAVIACVECKEILSEPLTTSDRED